MQACLGPCLALPVFCLLLLPSPFWPLPSRPLPVPLLSGRCKQPRLVVTTTPRRLNVKFLSGVRDLAARPKSRAGMTTRKPQPGPILAGIAGDGTTPGGTRRDIQPTMGNAERVGLQVGVTTAQKPQRTMLDHGTGTRATTPSAAEIAGEATKISEQASAIPKECGVIPGQMAEPGFMDGAIPRTVHTVVNGRPTPALKMQSGMDGSFSVMALELHSTALEILAEAGRAEHLDPQKSFQCLCFLEKMMKMLGLRLRYVRTFGKLKLGGG